MSSESQPITLSAFTNAIKALPLSAIYTKVFELRNSIAHLHRSNAELRVYIASNNITAIDNNEGGNIDEAGISRTASTVENQELETYILENEGVVAAMAERIGLCKAEIENRGQRWIELDDTNDDSNHDRSINGENDTDDLAGADSMDIDTNHIVNGLPDTGTGVADGVPSVRGANAVTVSGSSVNNNHNDSPNHNGTTVMTNQPAIDPRHQQDPDLDDAEDDQGVFL